MNDDEDQGAGVPEWVVTFGDMMSLLLTFFIMLVSLSEIKEKEKFQALVESLQRQFGYRDSQVSITPGNVRPRNSNLRRLATLGRARRFDTHRGGDRVSAPVGDYPQVRIVRPGSRTTVGTAITFEEGQTILTAAQQEILKKQAIEFGGKPQKIEIRGHTALRPLAGGAGDNFDLAYQRCRIVEQFLVDQGIERRRLRMSVAGPNEPIHSGADPLQLTQNPRVEVFALEEYVEDLLGEGAPQDQPFAGGAEAPE